MNRNGVLPLVAICCILTASDPAYPADSDSSLTARVDWYGSFKLDVAYDNAESSNGNFIMYVKPRVDGANTRTLNITARQTRVGLNVVRGEARGKLELDFYGGGPENKNVLMLRQAYLDVPLGPVSLLAGQTADLMSPLVPSTINYTVGWGAGNIGYRRPQIRLYGQSKNTFWGVALARNISGDLNGDAIVDGEASCIPVVEARLARTGFPGKRKTTLGVSGHFGLMDAPGADRKDYKTWSVNGDLSVQFSPRTTLLGELYTGANTGSYFGAILNNDCTRQLKSIGGWANLQVKASSSLTLSFGGGRDRLRNPEQSSVASLADARYCNTFFFGNFLYEVRHGMKLGLELSNWATKYLNVSPGLDPSPTDVRLQWTVMSDF